MTPSATRGPIVTLVVVLTAIGLVIGCGAPAPPTDGEAPPGSSTPGALTTDFELRYTCGTFGFDPALLDRDGNAEQGAGPIAVALRTHLAMSGPDFDTLPDTGWVLVGADDRRAEIVARDQAGSLLNVFLENGPAGWKVTGWGGCEPALALPLGLGRADWLPDPDGPVPNAATRAFRAQVTERDCASGQPSEGRVVGPVLLLDAEQVLVAFGVRQLPGGIQTCQGNPSTPVIIDLGQALGGRFLIDAGHLPFIDVREVDPDP